MLPRLDDRWRYLAARIARHPIVAIIGLYALSRIMLLAIGYLTVFAMEPGYFSTWDKSPVSLLCRWDCGWYLGIAERGYSPLFPDDQQYGASPFAFFPVYPMLMEAVHRLSGISRTSAGVVVSNLAFLVALIYLFRYTLLLGFSATTGLLAVAILCFVPQSFIFSAVYTESLFVLLLAAAMYHLRTGHFLLAGVLAAILSAVRANGVFFIFFALFWLNRAHGPGVLLRPWLRPELFLPIVLAPLGLFCFWAFSFHLTGDAFAQASSVSHGWGWRSGFIPDNLIAHLRNDPQSRFWVLSSLTVFAASLLLLRDRLWEEFGLCVLIFVLLWSSQLPNSLLRYSIVLFPVWIAVARFLEHRPVATAGALGAMALLNGFLMSAWTLGKLITI
jgi:hypothetical protein